MSGLAKEGLLENKVCLMAILNDTKPFPIQADVPRRGESGKMVYPEKCTIPWWLAEVAYEHYATLFGTSQSLERMAERGGFGRFELLVLLRRESYL